MKNRVGFIANTKLGTIVLISCLGLLLGAAGARAQAPDPDLNNDGIVNILDISLVGSCIGQDLATNPRCQAADTDGDGDVDFDDLNFVVASFGQSGFPVGEEDTIPPEVTITAPANLSFLIMPANSCRSARSCRTRTAP